MVYDDDGSINYIEKYNDKFKIDSNECFKYEFFNIIIKIEKTVSGEIQDFEMKYNKELQY